MKYRFNKDLHLYNSDKKITLKFTSGKTVILGIDRTDTVGDLKRNIWEEKLVDVKKTGYGRIVLSLSGTPLENEYNLYDNNTPNDIIDVTIRDRVIGPGVDLRGEILAGIDLSESDLSGAKFALADLSYTNLSDADLSGADLRSANLSGADLRGAYLYESKLGGANLRGAYLSGVVLERSHIGGIDLSGADLRGVNLKSAFLSYANLSNTNLSEADLSHATLRNANLSNANLRGANLEGADIFKANLSRANFTEANLQLAILTLANFLEVNLSRADLDNIDLHGANLSMVNLSGAILSGANLSYTNLSNANLSNANLSNADLFESNLSNANLRGADLSNANLSDADLAGADLFDAIIDDATRVMLANSRLFKAVREGDSDKIDEILKQIPESDEKQGLKTRALMEALIGDKAGRTIDLLADNRNAIGHVLQRFDLESVNRNYNTQLRNDELVTQTHERNPRHLRSDEKCKIAFDIIEQDDINLIDYLNATDVDDEDEKRNVLEKRIIIFFGDTASNLFPMIMTLDQLLYNIHTNLYTSDCKPSPDGSRHNPNEMKDAIFQLQFTSRYNVYLRNLIDVILNSDKRVFYILPLMDANGQRVVVPRVASIRNVLINNPLSIREHNFMAGQHCQNGTQQNMYGIYVCEGQGDNPLYPVCSD
jgi:uncharacterized protein YjbI with pentapeptide repeats